MGTSFPISPRRNNLNMQLKLFLVAAAAAAPTSLAFRGHSPTLGSQKVSMKASGAPKLPTLFKAQSKTTPKTLLQSKQQQEQRSQALPFLPSPTSLDGTWVGDVGFDPLGFAGKDVFPRPGLPLRSDKEVMTDYRDAELKHGRLAMLAAAAWPLQEAVNPILADKWNLPNLVQETGGLSPSLVNGGLEQAGVPVAIAVLLGGAAILEGFGAELKKQQGESWMPGDYGFDPAGIWKGLSVNKRREMQLRELKNGRLAMVAVLGYVVQEALTQTSALNAFKALW